MLEINNPINVVKLKVSGIPVVVTNIHNHPALNDFSNHYLSYEENANEPLVSIETTDSGLWLTWLAAPDKPLKFHIDIDKFTRQQFSYSAAKQGAFNRALGKKTKHIIDATAGWGRDAWLMCSQGYQVVMLERNPLMALLLKDAVTRLAATDWAKNNQVVMPKVICVDAINYFQDTQELIDCVYLDPMFPKKRKKSAAVNKNMQFLQWLVGEDLDAEKLAHCALQSNCSRVVVKRPDYAEQLIDAPSITFSSKLVHYDVFLKQ